MLRIVIALTLVLSCWTLCDAQVFYYQTNPVVVASPVVPAPIVTVRSPLVYTTVPAANPVLRRVVLLPAATETRIWASYPNATWAVYPARTVSVRQGLFGRRIIVRY
jgi:hypothetical protein